MGQEREDRADRRAAVESVAEAAGTGDGAAPGAAARRRPADGHARPSGPVASLTRGVGGSGIVTATQSKPSRFRYEAETLDGQSVKGTIEAASVAAARNELAVQGLRVIDLRERKGLQTEVTREKVPLVEVMHFSRQMATFLRAGVPITEALDTLRADAKNKKFAAVLADVLEAVGTGSTISDAIAVHSAVFPSYYLALLRAGELTGRMDDAFDQLHTYIKRDLELTRAVRKALIYPAILLVVAIAVSLLIVTFVIPRFADFFADFDAELPLPTRMLMAVADFVTSPVGIACFVLLGVVVVGLVLWTRTPSRPPGAAGLPAQGAAPGHRAHVRRHRAVLPGARLPAGCRRAPCPTRCPPRRTAPTTWCSRSGWRRPSTAPWPARASPSPSGTPSCSPPPWSRWCGWGSAPVRCPSSWTARRRSSRTSWTTPWTSSPSGSSRTVIVFIGLVVGFVALAMVSAMYGIYNQVEL